MTTSLRRIAECVDKTGAVSIKDDLLPVAQTALPGIPAIDLPADGSISALRLMRHLEWFWCRGDCVFQKMPVPTRFRSPSGEEAQILLDGIAERVSLFMGSSDDELDWHIYPRLDEATKAALREVGPLEDDKLWCEWMASDHSHDETLGRQWWSSDMDNVLMLRQLPDQRGATASEHWSLVEDDDQGGSSTTVAQIDDAQTRRNAGIIGGRVYLQGAFVRDRGSIGPFQGNHNHLEIHPLDSIAYARQADGAVIAARPTDAAWPDTSVRWRVAVLANSAEHKINGCGFLKQDRTTVWYLALPNHAGLPGAFITVTEEQPGFWHPVVGHPHQITGPFTFRHAAPTRRVAHRGVQGANIQPAPDGSRYGIGEFPVDPVDGRHKLRVSVTMNEPDDIGGYWLRDYRITVRFVVTGDDPTG
jgi:hypothetical protein